MSPKAEYFASNITSVLPCIPCIALYYCPVLVDTLLVLCLEECLFVCLCSLTPLSVSVPLRAVRQRVAADIV